MSVATTPAPNPAHLPAVAAAPGAEMARITLP